MAKKIELLHTTYDESGNVESQEVVHPLTSPDCIIMENGKTLDEVMGDGIATPTLTHEGTSFKVGVGDSNIEVVDGDVAGMTLKGQSYQNILPKPTTLIMETDEKEFKINDKIDSNIIIDDNIAEIATVKGKTIVNAVQEESGSEYTVLGEDLSGQSIVHVKETPTLEGNTLVNVLDYDNKAVDNSTAPVKNGDTISFTSDNRDYCMIQFWLDHKNPLIKPNTKYIVMYDSVVSELLTTNTVRVFSFKDGITTALSEGYDSNKKYQVFTTPNEVNLDISLRIHATLDTTMVNTIIVKGLKVFEYQEGMENWDIPYFEGTKYFESNIKGVTLQGQTLVNTIQEPCKDDYVVLGADDGIEISAETGGHGTIENTVQGGINGAVLEGQTLVNLANLFSFDDDVTTSSYFIDKTVCETSKLQVNKPYLICFKPTVKENLNTGNYVHLQLGLGNSKNMTEAHPTVEGSSHTCNINHNKWNFIKVTFKDFLGYQYLTVRPLRTDSPSDDKPITYNVNEGFMLLEYQDGMENWDIPYFEGMQSVQMPVVKTTGKNLYNINEDTTHCWQGTTQFVDGRIKITSTHNDGVTYHQTYNIPVKKGRTYHVNVNGEGDGDWWILWKNGDTSKGLNNPFTVDDTFDSVAIGLYCAIGEGNVCYYKPQIEEGSTATEYEPYQSSTVSINDYTLNSSQFEQGTFSESSPTGTPYRQTLPTSYMDTRLRSKSLFKISGNTIRGTLNAGYGIFFGFFKDGKYLAKHHGWMDSTNFSVDVPYECTEFCIILRKNISDTINVSEYDLIGLTLEQVVELRGIGDVKDELDLTTGKLTQRIGEVVLDGSEDEKWVLYPRDNYSEWTTYQWRYTLPSASTGFAYLHESTKTMCDELKYGSLGNDIEEDYEHYRSNGQNTNGISEYIYIWLSQSKASTTEELKTYLQSNPITVQYPLATESVKTIDLSVTDQDGNTMPHIQTQPTVTHITASSDYLIPTVTIDNNLAYDTIIKPSTLYTVRFKRGNVNADNPLTVDLGGTVQTVTSTEFTITTPSELTHNQLVFSGKNNVVSEVQVIEGDVTNIEYPFFEGMNDVKFSDSKFIATGKNLLYIPSNVELIGGYRQDVDISHSNGAITLSGKNPNITTTEVYVHTNICAYLVAGRTYTVSFKSDATPSKINGTDTVEMFLAWNNKYDSNNPYGKYKYTNIYNNTQTFTPALTGMYYLRLDLNLGSASHTFYDIQIEEGSVATSYEPYKGVEVQQDVDSIPLTSDMFEQGYYVQSNSIEKMSLQQIPKDNNAEIRIMNKSLVKVKPNTKYILNNDSVFMWALEFDKNGAYLGTRIGTGTDDTLKNYMNTNTYTEYVGIVLLYNATEGNILPSDLDSMNLILQEVPQEIVLRGIGDVKDELDLTRGEYIQRIGEVVYDGSDDEFWRNEEDNGDYTICKISLKLPCSGVGEVPISNIKCDRFEVGTTHKEGNKEQISIYYHKKADIYYSEVRLCIPRTYISSVTVQDFRNYIKNHPFTVQYVLETPIIHKVNLTNTKVIPSYATETHYETITPSDSLIPNITIPSTLNYDVAIKPSTEYTIRANTSDNLTVDLGGATGTLSNGKVTLTTPATLTHNEVKFGGTGKVKELMVVEGNEIKDNVPFFNGMKNVEMGGIKLVNVCRGMYTWNTGFITLNTNHNQITFTDKGSYGNIQFDETLLKSHTTYTVYFNITENTSTITSPIGVTLSQTNGKETSTYPIISAKQTGIMSFTITTDEVAKVPRFVVKSGSTDSKITIKNIMIIEGDWTHLDEIPFIESEMIIEQPIIRSQGKNLLKSLLNYDETYNFNSGQVTLTNNSITYVSQSNTYYNQLFYWVDVKPNTKYTLSMITNNITDNETYLTAFYDGKLKKHESSKGITAERTTTSNSIIYTLTTISDKLTVRFSNGTLQNVDIVMSSIQLEEGSSATPYEPYKHQTLYSNRVIGYEEGCYYGHGNGNRITNVNFNSIIADVEGLSVAYITHGHSNFSFWDKDGVYISGKSFMDTNRYGDSNNNGFITVPSNAKYIKFPSGNSIDVSCKYTDVTVTGELPLRSLPNGVCDTLNLVTGEYVQRVGEVVLDGVNIKPKWIVQSVTNNITSYFDFEKVFVGAKTASYTFSDKFIYEYYLYDDDRTRYKEGIRIGSEGWGSVRIFNSRLETSDYNGFIKWLQQNPITVQYELETPIVRKLGFTTKGNYREQVLDGSENWGRHGNYGTVTRFNVTIPNMVAAEHQHVFSDAFPKGAIGTNDLECINNHGLFNQFQFQIKTSHLTSDSVESLKQWLSLNPFKIGYLTTNSASLYSNIQKPIFFNNVKVQFMNDNVDIQPQLTLQARTRNSYVMDMMKANTTYTMKCLSYSDSARLWLSNGTANTSVATNKSFSFAQSSLDNANKQLVITGQWHEPMIIEGDVTGKNLPYFKGILSSYHDVDEIEIHSVTKNIFDGEMEIGALTDNTGDIIDGVCLRSKNFIKVHPNTPYYINCSNSEYLFATYHYDENYNFIRVSSTIQSGQTIVSQGHYIKIRTSSGLVQNDLTVKIWITETQGISYIPHAHNSTLIEMPTRLETVKVVRPVMEKGQLDRGNGQNYNDDQAFVRTKEYIPVTQGEVINIQNANSYRAMNIIVYDINKSFVQYIYTDGSGDVVIPKNGAFVRCYCGVSATSDLTITRQAYKPIQLNSLPNGVYDEIIMKPNSNKAQLVQRVGKVVLDGSGSYYPQPDKNGNMSFIQISGLYLPLAKGICGLLPTHTYCDKLMVGNPHFKEEQGVPSDKSCVGVYQDFVRLCLHELDENEQIYRNYLQQNPITVYYELATPIIHEIQLKGYPHVYEDGTVTLNTDTPHQTLVSYNVNQEQLINTQNETIIRHDQQIDDLYYYIEMYLEEIYQMELFRMKLELSL